MPFPGAGLPRLGEKPPPMLYRAAIAILKGQRRFQLPLCLLHISIANRNGLQNCRFNQTKVATAGNLNPKLGIHVESRSKMASFCCVP